MYKFLKEFFLFRNKKNKITYIFNFSDYESFICSLKDEEIIGVDTEFDWRTTYFPKICLLQISTKEDNYILDCISLNNLEELKGILESKDVLKIFHSVRSDSTVLSKCLNIKLQNVFDVQQAEKLISNGEILNYGYLVKKYIGITLDKKETNSNWLRRPLTESQINYAAEDVNFLIDIFEFQRKVLSENELRMAFEYSDLENSLGKENLAELRLHKKKNKLSIKEQKIFMWREKKAEYENIPPNYIFKEKHISHLAKESLRNSTNLKKSLFKIMGDSKYVDEFILKFK
tara:strand:+ start:4541 stop:5404 length:864 start_codon:yes stop_codon:yes gene_type:complete